MALQTDRLERLAVMVADYRPQPGQPEFDLYEWGETRTRRGGFLWLQKIECGTQACAVGMACLSGAFSSDGLTYIVEDGGMIPVYGGKENWAAVRAFFGLSEKQAHRLFDSDKYAVSTGPRAAVAVSARIRAMIKRSEQARRTRPTQRTSAAVEKIKAAALGPVRVPAE